MYINFQTKSGHLTDPVEEAIDLFEHTLDKTALVWFQTNRSKFKDLTMLKTMFLQRYNPWGKTKREQLQSWNILSFNPKTTDVDEHIDLINTLYGPPYSLCGGFNHSPRHCYKGEHDINNIMEKMSINPHQSQQNNLYQ